MKRLSRNQVLIGASALIVILSVAGYLIARGNNTEVPQSPTITTDTSGIDYGPPTEEEKAEAERHKEELARQMEQESQPTGSEKKQVTPVITNASQNGQEAMVSAYIQGIFENGGVCTVTFTKGSQKITKTSEAFADASTTICKSFAVSRSEFDSAGDWQVVVSYSSQTSEGSSQTKNLALE